MFLWLLVLRRCLDELTIIFVICKLCFFFIAESSWSVQDEILAPCPRKQDFVIACQERLSLSKEKPSLLYHFLFFPFCFCSVLFFVFCLVFVLLSFFSFCSFALSLFCCFSRCFSILFVFMMGLLIFHVVCFAVAFYILAGVFRMFSSSLFPSSFFFGSCLFLRFVSRRSVSDVMLLIACPLQSVVPDRAPLLRELVTGMLDLH